MPRAVKSALRLWMLMDADPTVGRQEKPTRPTLMTPLETLKAISYAAAPIANVTLAYNAVNQLTNMLDAVGTTAFSYTGDGLLQARASVDK